MQIENPGEPKIKWSKICSNCGSKVKFDSRKEFRETLEVLDCDNCFKDEKKESKKTEQV